MILAICTGIAGIFVGVLFCSIINKFAYSGTMWFKKFEDGKVVYTLEIDGDLDLLQYKKHILLKISPEVVEEVEVDDSLVRE
jgi:hypothetical protein